MDVQEGAAGFVVGVVAEGRDDPFVAEADRRRLVRRGDAVIYEWFAGALHAGERRLGAPVERRPDGGGLLYGVRQVDVLSGVPGFPCPAGR